MNAESYPRGSSQPRAAPDVMARGNFNIVFPLGDWLFGTLRRERRDDAAAQGAGEGFRSGSGS